MTATHADVARSAEGAKPAEPVTVVIATRNRPKEVREAITAILEQEYAGSIEILVVHDHTDLDLSLESDQPARRVRVMPNDRPQGLAGARNTGIMAATGTYVAFCDDDDIWLAGKLRKQVATLDADPTLGLVACGIRISYNGKLSDRVLPQQIVTFPQLLRSRLTELHPSTFCIRRTALLDGFGLVEENIPGSYSEDYEFLLRAARAHPLRTVPEVLAEIRWHPQSYFDGRWTTISTAQQWLLARYPEFATVPAGYARIAGQIAFADASRGARRSAVRWAARTVRRNPREARAYLALLVAGRLVSPETVLHRLHERGKGL